MLLADVVHSITFFAPEAKAQKSSTYLLTVL